MKTRISFPLKNAKWISSIVLFACSFLALMAAATPSWTLLGPSGSTFSLFRSGSSTVYDPSSNRIILFSGSSDDVGGNAHLNDVWVETNANGLGGAGAWSNLIPDGTAGSPPGRYNHSAVYDVANNRMVKEITVGIWAGSPPSIPMGKQSGLRTPIATESISSCVPTES
jgi:hypothetical protein